MNRENWMTDNRGREPLSNLRTTEPYLRWTRFGPLVILTRPARYALVIEPDGRVAVRSLNGITADSRGQRPTHELRGFPIKGSPLDPFVHHEAAL